MAVVATSVAAVTAAAITGTAGAALGAACGMKEVLKLQLSAISQRQAPKEEGAGEPAPSTKRRGSAASVQDAEMAGWQGFSMEEARELADQGHHDAALRTPAEVLRELQKGNTRFWMGAATRPEKSAFERRALISKQFPSVAILGCSDSRVPTEIVFDQGLGDMFVVRVAGNTLDTSTTASLQYAVHHLKVKVLIVMGHEGCGAVKAASLPEAVMEKEPAELCSCLKSINRGLDFKRLANVHDSRAHDREAVVTNVIAQVAGLTKDASIMRKVDAGELLICGAFYEISSGIVDFFSEVSQADALHRSPSRGVATRFNEDASACLPCKAEK